MKSKLTAIFDLLRIYNFPIPLTAILAGIYAAPHPAPDRVSVGVFWALMGCLVVQGWNDYHDAEVDCVNAPHRPIPSGKLSKKEVRALVYAVFAICLLSALYYNVWCAVLGLLAFSLAKIYPPSKRITVLNHAVMPLLEALLPLAGSLLAHGAVLPLAWYAAGLIFFMDLNMNIVGSFKDLHDTSIKERVLPVIAGPRFATLVSLFSGLLALSIGAAPVLLHLVKPDPLVLLSIAAFLTLRSRIMLFQNPDAKTGYRALKEGRLAEIFSYPALITGILPAFVWVPLISAVFCFTLYTQTVIPENILR